MRIRTLFAAAVMTSLAAPTAQAELPYPTVDYEADWVVEGPDGESFRSRAHYRAADRKMRIEMTQSGMEMSGIQDIEAGELVFWSDQMPGMAMRVAAGPDDMDVDPRRTEMTQTVDGESCTVWTTPEVEVCLTEDNIPLETSGQGFTAQLANLQRTSQDDALFEVPADLQIMEMPEMPESGDAMPGGFGLPY